MNPLPFTLTVTSSGNSVEGDFLWIPLDTVATRMPYILMILNTWISYLLQDWRDRWYHPVEVDLSSRQCLMDEMFWAVPE